VCGPVADCLQAARANRGAFSMLFFLAVTAATAALPAESARSNWLTVASIGIVACLAADMVHEALGHGTASLLTHDPILSLSTVAVQNAVPNRIVSAAGTSANCFVGALSFLLLRRATTFSSRACFLWLFGAFNLLNSGYLVVSAFTSNGDWANVIFNLSPAWLWRCVLGLAGAIVYYFSVRWAVILMVRLVERTGVALADLWRLILPAYISGGIVMTIAAVFNPISPSLILLSGAGASFGLNAGLLFVPGFVSENARTQSIEPHPLRLSLFWLFLALLSAGFFIAVLGPGIRFSR